MYPLAGEGDAAAQDIVTEVLVIDEEIGDPGEAQIVCGMVHDTILFFFILSVAQAGFV